MAAGTQPGLLGAIGIDLRVLHETWMELLFPRQRDVSDTAFEKWRPETPGQTVAYYLWALAGLFAVTVGYPLLLAGYFVRYQTRKVGAAGARLGFLGIVVLFALVWGGLTATVAVRSSAFQEGAVVALAAASGVSVVSAALSFLCWRVQPLSCSPTRSRSPRYSSRRSLRRCSTNRSMASSSGATTSRPG
jgi:hypothetical protein